MMSFLRPKRLKGSKMAISIYAALVTFCTYTLIFGYRKAFTVATFENITIFGYSYKTTLVIVQVLGYMLAKLYGVKYIAELRRTGRGLIILSLTAIAWFSWLGFALTPAPYNVVFLFINGFPLGILWGVVFSYVEGREGTDFIGAALAVSFIFASGFARSAGGWIMLTFNLSEFWVPFCTGLLFSLPLILLVHLMEKIPSPDASDTIKRMVRKPMDAQQRRSFIKTYLPGLVACILIYTIATIFRDIRDNFGAEMWKEMNFDKQPALFSQTETPITLIILVLIGAMVLIKNNFKALLITHGLIAFGFVCVSVATLTFLFQLLPSFTWMLLTGLGLYMVYIPFNAIFFDRLLAAFKHTGNVGFLIYLADAFAYVASLSVLISKEVLQVKLSWVSFFSNSVLGLSACGLLLTAFSAYYFRAKYRKM
ncbi:DUF5690 family protein [Olivibacter sp. XZL3]|uniref:DUF5690 family protein n=1 Tax=Olivibacter sp. XZL3 TaxID=1735116 RepID=UPI001F0ED518|nr:DUF5690 family protein [Olivibacter sp. XZL3]